MAIATGVNVKPVLTASFEVGADLSTKQFYGVKMSADRTVVLQAADTDRPVGLLQNKPDNSTIKDAEVLVIGQGKAVAAETLAAGDQIRIDSNGKAAKHEPGTDTTAYGVGIVTVGGASNEVIEGLFDFASAARGA